MTRPAVVAIGGGHGAAQTLHAAKRYAGEITAIISVADDGGSSGRLREHLGIPAPGDLRRCIGALLPEGSPYGPTLEHRFGSGELAGHAFGNLLIAALAETAGDFADGVQAAADLLGAVGRVYPATSSSVVLKGTGDAGEVSGQAKIGQRGGVSRVELIPPDPYPPPGAVAAISAADQIVIGPGSLFTSILAAMAVPALREAVASASGQRVYVANLREQPPETAGFDVAAHLRALADHGVEIDVVLAHEGGLPVGDVPAGVVVRREIVALPSLAAHDPLRLAAALESLVLASQGQAAGE